MSLIVYNESRVQPANHMNETDLTGQSSPADPGSIAKMQERNQHLIMPLHQSQLLPGALCFQVVRLFVNAILLNAVYRERIMGISSTEQQCVLG